MNAQKCVWEQMGNPCPRTDKTPTYEELVNVLEGMVNQHCSIYDKKLGKWELDSMALRDNHDAIKLLGRLGLLTIESEVGRRIIAHWNVPEVGGVE